MSVACTQPDKASNSSQPEALRLERVFAASADSLDTQYPFMAQSGPDRRIIVSSLSAQRLPGVFDSTGRLIQLLGARGGGPGEFSSPLALIKKQDSILITDASSNGAKLFDRDGRFVRSFDPLRRLAGGIFLRGDSFVVAGNVRTPESFGYPLHLYSERGELVRSFGASDRTLDPARPMEANLIIVAATDSTFWVARYSEYRLELWGTDGVLHRRLELARDWYPPAAANRSPVDLVRPTGCVIDIQPDEHGHLLVLLYRARKDWQASGESRGGERPVMIPSDYMRYVDEVVEVLDSNTGAVLGQVTHEGDPLAGILADGRIFGFHADSLGRQLPSVWRLVHRVR